MGERRVSLGESGRFVKGKSEFPLRKVKEAEKDGKQAISGAMEDSENALHLFYCHTDDTDSHRFFIVTQKFTEITESAFGTGCAQRTKRSFP